MPTPTRHFSRFTVVLALAVVAGCTEPGSAEPDTDADIDAPDTVDGSPFPLAPADDPIAAGRGRSCLIRGGDVLCWGGFFTATPPPAPERGEAPAFLAPYGTFESPRAVDADWGQICVVDGAGALWCENAFAPELGLARVEGLADVVAVDMGLVEHCALVTDGRVFCGETPTTWLPVEDVRATVLANGPAHTCVLDPSGALSCWGTGNAGQLGLGAVTEAATPTAVETDVRFVRLAAGFHSTCAVDDAEGAVWCWGAINGANRPTRVDGLQGAREVVVGGGDASACAIVGTGEVWCWDTETAPAPIGIDDADRIDGSDHYCVLRASGDVACWGANELGQVGAPMPLSDGALGTVDVPPTQAVAAAGDRACALAAAGEVWCWGGAGTTDGIPQRVAGLPSADRLALGSEALCVRAEGDRHVWCADALDDGQWDMPSQAADLGPVDGIALAGTRRCTHTGPTVRCERGGSICASGGEWTVLGLERISLGFGSVCATTDTALTACWGEAADGDACATEPTPAFEFDAAPEVVVAAQTRCGRFPDRVVCTPHLPGGAVIETELVGEFASLWSNAEPRLTDDATHETVCAVRSADGGLECVGGLAAPTDGLLDVEAVALGDGFGCVVQTGGALRCWGRNEAHQLGDGGLDWVAEPYTVALPD